ncbi:MAG TPA: hypothetical protein VNC40_15000 [Gaiellaceae bacterium]|nr:hypothetical protein [Gaiellaceae bacterium]
MPPTSWWIIIPFIWACLAIALVAIDLLLGGDLCSRFLKRRPSRFPGD